MEEAVTVSRGGRPSNMLDYKVVTKLLTCISSLINHTECNEK